MKNEGRIVAHIGAWPLRIPTSRGIVDSLHAIDWASDREFAGMGALLLRNLTRRVEVTLGLGGTNDAKRVLPGLGFSSIGEADVYARLVRPWNVFRGSQQPSARSFARLVRTAFRSFGVRASRGGWSAKAVTEFVESDLEPVSGVSSGQVIFPDVSAAMLNVAMACPGAHCRAFTLWRNGKRVGYLLLSRPDGQVRVADLRIRSEAPEDWAAAYSLALELASDDPRCNEIMSFASTDLLRKALAANGFRRVGSRQVKVIDRGKILQGLPPLQLQSITTDAFFISVPSREYYLA